MATPAASESSPTAAKPTDPVTATGSVSDEEGSAKAASPAKDADKSTEKPSKADDKPKKKGFFAKFSEVKDEDEKAAQKNEKLQMVSCIAFGNALTSCLQPRLDPVDFKTLPNWHSTFVMPENTAASPSSDAAAASSPDSAGASSSPSAASASPNAAASSPAANGAQSVEKRKEAQLNDAMALLDTIDKQLDVGAFASLSPDTDARLRAQKRNRSSLKRKGGKRCVSAKGW